MNSNESKGTTKLNLKRDVVRKLNVKTSVKTGVGRIGFDCDLVTTSHHSVSGTTVK